MPLFTAARELRATVDRLRFAAPVTHVYNPLDYAWAGHEAYLARFGRGPKKVIFLGMNPGPYGMAQTGVPFGEIAAVRDWMGLMALVARPAREHPKRPIEGWGCARSEVSGRRLWGLFAERYPKADDFFRDHFVANYCPLVFMNESGANITPDKLPASERAPLEAACDAHLAAIIHTLRPEWVIGVGAWAQGCAERVCAPLPERPKIGTILHPSPASPVANKHWPVRPREQLQALGIWS